MPRQPRERSATGIYHIMLRGVNKENIFCDDEDRRVFLYILKKVSLVCSYQLLAYCLMTNHVHLLLQENDNITSIMRRLGTRYARYFNSKYERVGHLLQDRYKSEKVETDQYLLTVLRYIHQNPIKAHYANSLDYAWSSHRAYLGLQNNNYPVVDTELILSYFAMDRTAAIESYKEYVSYIDYHAKCLEYEELLTDSELKQKIELLLQGLSINELHKMNIYDRNKLIVQIKNIEGTSIRQISKVTGIGRYVIANVRESASCK